MLFTDQLNDGNGAEIQANGETSIEEVNKVKPSPLVQVVEGSSVQELGWNVAPTKHHQEEDTSPGGQIDESVWTSKVNQCRCCNEIRHESPLSIDHGSPTPQYATMKFSLFHRQMSNNP